jgi:zinc and cadmium transporter
VPSWLIALLAVTLISLLSLIGVVTLSLGRHRLEKIIFLLVSFAVGAMLGGALLHLIPASYEALGSGTLTGALVLVGVVAFFVLEKFLHWQHEHGAPEALEGATGHHGHSHAIVESGGNGAAPFAKMNIIGAIGHNLIDGAIVAAAFLVSVPTGIVTTLAVMSHEIPQQMGNFGILVYGGYAPRQALLYNLAAGLTGLIGAGALILLGTQIENLADYLLPITAGAFLYIAGSDLIPELNRRHSYPATKSVWQLIMILCGVGLIAGSLALGGHIH